MSEVHRAAQLAHLAHRLASVLNDAQELDVGVGWSPGEYSMYDPDSRVPPALVTWDEDKRRWTV